MVMSHKHGKHGIDITLTKKCQSSLFLTESCSLLCGHEVYTPIHNDITTVSCLLKIDFFFNGVTIYVSQFN